VGITPVQEIATATADGVTAITKAYTSNVAAGNLLVITCGRFNATQVAFTAADCTMSAGTATLGTITLDAHAEATPTEAIESAVWSVPVLVGGSVTIRIAGSTGAYFELNVNEYSTIDVSGSRVSTPTSNSTNTAGVSPATAPSITTSDDSLFVGAVATDYGGTNLAPVAGNAFTLIGSSTNGSLHQTGASVRKIVTGGSTDSLSVSLATASLNGWCACLVAYKAAVIASASTAAPTLSNPARPFNRIIGRVAMALRTVRPPAAVASAATPVTFTPSAAVSTWTAPDPVLSTGGVTLSPAAASSTWVAGTPTLTVGALSLAPVAATSTWTVPAPSLSAGALSLTPTAATSSCVAPAPVLSAGPLSLAPSASASAWTAGAATLTSGALTFTPAAAVSTWTAGTASLGGGSQLTPSAAVSTWVAGVATLTPGALTLSPTAPSRAWISGAPFFTPGGLALASTAPASTWTVPAPVLAAGAVTLAPAAAARVWNAGAPSLSVGAISLLSSTAVAVWVVPSPSFFSNTTIHLDEPLSIDFASLETEIEFTPLTTTIDFSSLESMLVFLDGGQTVFELTIIKGEVATITGVLQGADPITDALVPYDVSAASTLKLNAGKSGSLIITNKDLTKVNGGATGQFSYTNTAGESAVAGKYDALAVATFPDGKIRKFPGKLTIKDAIA
jgi:hypothetical protein